MRLPAAFTRCLRMPAKQNPRNSLLTLFAITSRLSVLLHCRCSYSSHEEYSLDGTGSTIDGPYEEPTHFRLGAMGSSLSSPSARRILSFWYRDRFGLYRGRNVGYGNFAGFIHYTAKVNSFMPASAIPFLAWAAT